MTERGTRARWTTAALIAPATAAVFTGTTVWAAGHQPVTTSAKPAVAPAAAAEPTVDPAVAELQAAVDEARAQVADLRVAVSQVTKQANAVIKGQKAATVAITSRASSSSSARSSRSTSSSSSSAPKKKSSPPPTQGSTGASG